MSVRKESIEDLSKERQWLKLFCVHACWTLHPPRLLCHCSSRTRTWASLTPDSPDRRPSTARMTPDSATVPSSPSLWDFVLSFPLFLRESWGSLWGSLFWVKFSFAAVHASILLSWIISLPLQGFTYVAPSVLESLKEGFSFEPRTRTVRRHNSSPRTPNR